MKFSYKVFILVFIMMVAVSPAFAWYNRVTGEIRDSVTGELWEHGATVEIYDCDDSDPLISGDVPQRPTAGWGTFDIPLGPGFQNVTTLCIKIDINPVNGYDPGVRILQIPNDPGGTGVTLNTGTTLTNSGPTVVVLSGFTARSSAHEPWQLYAVAVAALALLSAGLSFARRKSLYKIFSK